MTELNRSTPPPFQLSTDYSLTLPEVVTSPQGVKLFAFRGLQQAAVKVEWLFDAGKWFESKPGQSHFTAQMLTKGTRTKDAFTIAEQLDSLGAHVEINPGFDVVSLSLYTLKKNLPAAIEIIREILQEPVFDEKELELMKEIFIQNLRVNNDKTAVVASREIRKAIFGSAHPYGTSLEEITVKQLTRADLHQFYGRQFHLRSVFVVGQVDDHLLRDVVELVPRLNTNHPHQATYRVEEGKSARITMPGKVQSSIRLGKRILPRRDDKSYFEAVMFNHVLGGFFGSRLMKNIREEKGLTYGIYSALHHFERDGFWMVGAEVNQQNTGAAIEEIKREIKRLQEEPIPLQELEIARNYFIGSWQSENATLFSVAEKFKSLHLYGLHDSYFTHLLTYLSRIQPSQILQAGQEHFSTGDWMEVVVG